VIDWLQLTRTIPASVLLWFAGAVFFDAVHAALHFMLRSRSSLLRKLAWPHSVHHQWLDGTLTIRWENQRRNVWCHLVPEFATQLVFSLMALAVLPRPVVAGCVALQVAVFSGMLWYRGLDVNHREIALLDAYRPSFFCYPAYHALHHVHQDAYFSAYGKLVDWVLGSGTCLAGRTVALQGTRTAFGRALARRLRDAGCTIVADAVTCAADACGADVVVLCDPGDAEAQWVEEVLAAHRSHQVPPEVWSVHETVADRLARHYYRDVRVIYRTILVRTILVRTILVRPGVVRAGPARAGLAQPPLDEDIGLQKGCRADEAEAWRAAGVAVFCIRRGLHFVPTTIGWRALVEFRRFRRVTPAVPPGVRPLRTRAEQSLEPAIQ